MHQESPPTTTLPHRYILDNIKCFPSPQCWGWNSQPFCQSCISGPKSSVLQLPFSAYFNCFQCLFKPSPLPIPNQKKSVSEDFSDCRLSDTFALKIHTQVNREEMGWLAGPLSLALASLWAGKPEPPCKAFLTRSLSNRRTFPLTFWSCSQLPFTRTPPGAARKFTVTHILRGSPPSLSSLHPARQEPVDTGFIHSAHSCRGLFPALRHHKWTSPR